MEGQRDKVDAGKKKTSYRVAGAGTAGRREKTILIGGTNENIEEGVRSEGMTVPRGVGRNAHKKKKKMRKSHRGRGPLAGEMREGSVYGGKKTREFFGSGKKGYELSSKK